MLYDDDMMKFHTNKNTEPHALHTPLIQEDAEYTKIP
jgi:hypothetical protein